MLSSQTVSKTTGEITEYIGKGIERMSMMEKDSTLIMLKDSTRIVVPRAMRSKLLEREHLAHTGIIKMSASIRAKYFWPGIEGDVKRLVEACEPCQIHGRAQAREPRGPALEYMSRPMQSIGIDFFQRKGSK